MELKAVPALSRHVGWGQVLTFLTARVFDRKPEVFWPRPALMELTCALRRFLDASKDQPHARLASGDPALRQAVHDLHPPGRAQSPFNKKIEGGRPCGCEKKGA